MPDSRRVTNIEKKLGFKWEPGISLAKRESCKVRIIKRLIDDIDALKQKYVRVLPSQLRHLEEFHNDCYELYKKLAPRLWADPPVDRSAWLVDASINSWNGLYERDLFVSKDDELLQDLFTTLVFEKCVRYHENQKQQARRTLKSHNDSESSDVTSPEIQYEDWNDSCTYLSPQYANASSNSFATTTPYIDQFMPRKEKNPDRGVDRPTAPVAQMIPGQPHSQFVNTPRSLEQHEDAHSKSESMSEDDSDDEPAPECSWKPATTGTTRYPIGSPKNIVDPDYTPGTRKRNGANASKAMPFAKRQKHGFAIASDEPPKRTSIQYPKHTERSSAVVKLRLKHTPSRTALSSAKVSPPTSGETSIIHVSRMPPPSNGTEVTQNCNGDFINKGQHANQIAQETSSSSLGHQSVTAGPYSQPSSCKKEKSTPESRIMEDKSIYDFPGSPTERHRQIPSKRDGSAGRPEPSVEHPESSVAGQNATSSHETSQHTSSLYNECSDASTTRHRSSVPSDANDAQGATQDQEPFAIPNVTVDETSAKTEMSNAATAGTSNAKYQAYVESCPESADGSTPKPSAPCERIAQSNSAFQDNSAKLFKESEQNVNSNSSTRSDSGNQAEAISDGLEPNVATTCSEAESVKGQPDQPDISDGLKPSPAANFSELSPAQHAQKLTTVTPFEHPAVTTGDQSNPPDAAGMGRKLLLQLITSEAKMRQFIAVGFDCPIEILFEKVEKRMNPRLDHKPIKYIKLCLPSQPDEPYLIQRDDPDTWEEFLEMAEEEVGHKIKVTADVEF